jgi:hypothetical protein
VNNGEEKRGQQGVASMRSSGIALTVCVRPANNTARRVVQIQGAQNNPGFIGTEAPFLKQEETTAELLCPPSGKTRWAGNFSTTVIVLAEWFCSVVWIRPSMSTVPF